MRGVFIVTALAGSKPHPNLMQWLKPLSYLFGPDDEHVIVNESSRLEINQENRKKCHDEAMPSIKNFVH